MVSKLFMRLSLNLDLLINLTINKKKGNNYCYKKLQIHKFNLIFIQLFLFFINLC